MEFLKRPYWTRVWIIQELALSRTITLHCGSHDTNWSRLTSALKSPSLKYLPYPSIVNAQNLAEFRSNAQANEPVSFLEALQRSSIAKSTDPRNKVFALLGLVYDAENYIIIPSYKQSTRRICISMTMSAIFTTRSIQVILLAPDSGSQFLSRSDSSRSSEHLPSWCPDWLALGTSASLKIDVLNRRHSIPQQHILYVTQEALDVTMINDILRTDGRIISQISEISPSYSEVFDHVTTSPVCSSRIVDRHPDIKNPESSNPGEFISVINGFGRAMIALWFLYATEEEHDKIQRLMNYGDPNTSFAFAAYWATDRSVEEGKNLVSDESINKWLTLTKTLDLVRQSLGEMKAADYKNHLLSPSTDVANIWYGILARVLRIGLRLAACGKTEGRWKELGWVHPNARSGDSICILRGFDIPVVLRQDELGRYFLIGEAHFAVEPSADDVWDVFEIH